MSNPNSLLNNNTIISTQSNGTTIDNGYTYIGDYTQHIDWNGNWYTYNNYKQTYYTTTDVFDQKHDYMEFIAKMLGLPSYEDFLNMSEAEKKAIIRKETIDRVLNEDK